MCATDAAAVAPPHSARDLRGGRLLGARAGYLVLASFAAVTFLRSLTPWIESVDVALRATAADLQVPHAPIAAFVVVLGLLAVAAYVATALVILLRRSRDLFVLFASLTLVVHGLGFVTGLGALLGSDAAWSLPVVGVASLHGICAVLFLYAFPDGRFVPRWLGALWVVWAGWVIAGIPFNEVSPVLGQNEPWDLVVAVFFLTVGLLAQAYRYRRVSTPHERQQTKWVTFGIGVYALVFALSEGLRFAFPGVLEPGVARLAYLVLVPALDDLAALGVPLTLAIAILRHELFDIDLILSRTLVYGTVMAILAGIFTAASTLAQRILMALTGQQSDVATILIAIGVAAAFAPLRGRVQGVVDERLRRRGARPSAV